MGNDKTQIVMFVSDDFAAAAAGQNFSDAFPNTRHSVLISNLTAAVRDQDATQLDWFRDVFLPGDGAAAAFATGGSFSVAEFTSLTVIGTSVTSGNWSVDSLQDIVTSSPIGSSGLPTSTVDETATDLGPFDVEFENTRNPGDFAMELNITNDSGVAWTNIELQLGTGLGEQFEISTSGDVQFTIDSLTYEDTSGAFTDVVVEENRLVFSGLLPAGQTANLVTFLTTSTVPQTFTLRQTAVPEPAGWILQVVGTLIVAVTAKKRRAQ